MKFLITGATGLVGRNFTNSVLEAGHQVHFLTTRKAGLNTFNNAKGFVWDPKNNSIDRDCFDGVEVIVHLAGATVSKRWTKAYKNEILESRLNTTKTLLEGLKKTNKHQVKQIVSASAIGIYKDHLTQVQTETDLPSNTSFLATVVQEWEKAVDEFEMQNINVAKLRIGLVLALSGGALPSIMLPIKWGLGAWFGHGQQYQSWIHIKDLTAAFLFLAVHNHSGVFNAVAPKPVSNKFLTIQIAKCLKKPLWLPSIPKFFMDLIMGEMSQLMFQSQFVSSEKIIKKGFRFQFSSIEAALQDLLEKKQV